VNTRPIAIAIAAAVGASAFLLVGRPAGVNPSYSISVVDLPGQGTWLTVPPEPPQPGRFGDAQPCLIDTVSCLELSPEPFAPCLLAVERCSSEWRLHPLAGRNTD
jgi:hypothetical protein